MSRKCAVNVLANGANRDLDPGKSRIVFGKTRNGVKVHVIEIGEGHLLVGAEVAFELCGIVVASEIQLL